MNLLSRAITSHHFLLSTYQSRKCLFPPRPITAFHQVSLYSTTNHQSNTTRLRTQQPRKPRTHKSSDPSSSSSSSLNWSEGVKKSAEELPTWPKPSEIPYQSKVANSVNLIGHVQFPVQFHATPVGKHLAATFISQENRTNSSFLYSKSPSSLMIPVVFEGDLAHIVACHVKQNDCVYVIGKLCVDPLPFVLSENQGKFHIVGQEINFVQGFDRKFPGRTNKDFGEVVDAVSKLDSVENKNVAKEDVGDSLLSVESDQLDSLKFDDRVDENSLNIVGTTKDGNVEDKIDQKRLTNAAKTKDGDSIFNFWRDLVRNPQDWWDNREDKSNGLRKANYPDFKHRTSGNGLWLNKAPQWVLPGIQGLEFDVQTRKGKQAKGAKEEDNWKSLVENPDKWWDNRSGKRNERAPDFRHKETGEGLWLNSSPEWVLSRLPPLQDEKTKSACII